MQVGTSCCVIRTCVRRHTAAGRALPNFGWDASASDIAPCSIGSDVLRCAARDGVAHLTFVMSGLHTLPSARTVLCLSEASASYVLFCSVDMDVRGKAQHGWSCIAYGCGKVCRLLPRVLLCFCWDAPASDVTP